jgi:hypothetical protein
MPLAFNSLSHGEIVFGFFNVETDLLILDTYFMFASDFCNRVAALAEGQAGEQLQTEWEVYALKEEEIGNLTGAVHGMDLRGFMGDVYRRFPFPEDIKAFQQNPEGAKTQQVIRGMIERYASAGHVTIIADGAGSTMEIGDYLFSREEFHNLLRYLWRGGYPAWRAGARPDYLTGMKDRIIASRHPLFDDFSAFI